MRAGSTAAVAAVLAVVAATPGAVDAQCMPTGSTAGIVQQVCEQAGRRWVVVTADLAASNVDVRVSRPPERATTVETWGDSVAGSVLAIQGGPFRFPDFETRGLTVGMGEAWAARDDAQLGVLALDGAGGAIVADPDFLVPHEEWMTAAVSGRTILRDGTVITSCTPDGCDARPRTAVGLGEDGRSLIIVSVEGWTSRSDGITDPDLAELMRGNGVFDAIRVGEGATSVLWSRADGMLIPSSDGASRPTAAFLALVDRAGATDGRLVGVVKRAMEPLDPLPDAVVRISTTDGTEVSVPSLLTSTAYWDVSLPSREYIVRASRAGYTTGCNLCTVLPGGKVWCSIFLEEGSGERTCTPEPTTIEPGAWPRADGGPAAGDAGSRDAGVLPPPGSGDGCGVSGHRASGAGAAGALAIAVVLLASRARRSSRVR
jgi:hypothetical protein